jgi:hypothetical protein
MELEQFFYEKGDTILARKIKRRKSQIEIRKLLMEYGYSKYYARSIVNYFKHLVKNEQ